MNAKIQYYWSSNSLCIFLFLYSRLVSYIRRYKIYRKPSFHIKLIIRFLAIICEFFHHATRSLVLQNGVSRFGRRCGTLHPLYEGWKPHSANHKATLHVGSALDPFAEYESNLQSMGRKERVRIEGSRGKSPENIFTVIIFAVPSTEFLKQ